MHIPLRPDSARAHIQASPVRFTDALVNWRRHRSNSAVAAAACRAPPPLPLAQRRRRQCWQSAA
eukprot:2180412-Pleurochrysis_carterae.AAC.1